MYTILSILCRLNKDWNVVDFSTITVSSLLKNYSKVLITLEDSSTSQITQYNLSDFIGVRNTYLSTTLISFISNYAAALPTSVNPILSLSAARHLQYSRIWEYGLNANRCVYNNTELAGNINYQPDIKITPTSNFNVALSDLQNHILYLVNGLVFIPTVVNNIAFLLGASYTLDKYTSQSISVLDFSPLGGFNLIPITISNASVFISSVTDTTIIVTLTSPISNQTPLLIQNQRLHILDDSYVVLSPTTIAIKLNNKTILSDLLNTPVADVNWVQPSDISKNGYNIASVNCLNYITSGTSYILLVNTNELSIKKTNMFPSGFVGKYHYPTVPTGIMYLADGTIGDWIVSGYSTNMVEISVTPPRLINAIKDTMLASYSEGINNASYSYTTTLTNVINWDLYIL